MITIKNLIGGNITITTKPAGNPKTKITFTDGNVQEYDWSGEINANTMINAGLLTSDQPIWIKNPQTVEIGTGVTSIGGWAFYNCNYLNNVTIPNSVKSIGTQAFTYSNITNVTIPDSVTIIQYDAFQYCSLTSITFSGKDKATVQGMENYNWYLDPGCVLHCTDGDITI